MLRTFRALFALTAFALTGLAACKAAPQTANPAIWHLSDADSDIWLFGTVHILPPSLKWRTAKIDAAFQSADTLILETPIDAAAQGDIVATMQRHGYNPEGVTLSSLLTAQDRARLQRVAKKLKLKPELLEPARPWLAALQISVAQVVTEGQAAESGVDQVLDREAKAQNKKRRYFETAEQQIRFFADLPSSVEVQFLSVTLREVEEEEESIDDLDAAWARGDVKGLSHELNGMLQETGPEVYDALIRQRNAKWAEEIDTMMKGSGKTFIAVGAAHLVGDDGVPTLLRKKGYTVEGP